MHFTTYFMISVHWNIDIIRHVDVPIYPYFHISIVYFWYKYRHSDTPTYVSCYSDILIHCHSLCCWKGNCNPSRFITNFYYKFHGIITTKHGFTSKYRYLDIPKHRYSCISLYRYLDTSLFHFHSCILLCKYIEILILLKCQCIYISIFWQTKSMFRYIDS